MLLLCGGIPNTRVILVPSQVWQGFLLWFLSLARCSGLTIDPKLHRLNRKPGNMDDMRASDVVLPCWVTCRLLQVLIRDLLEKP